jgi:hypothetical protein
MTKEQVNNLLYKVYSAGFTHGVNEGAFPTIGTFDAFNRLIIGESPLNDGDRYDIKEKVDKLVVNVEEK